MNDGEQLYASSLPGYCAWIAAGEVARQLDVGLAGLDPEQVGVGGEGQAAADHGVEAGAHAVEALARALAGGERPVALVDVARQQVGREGVGAGDDHRRHAGDIRRQPCRVQRADVLLRRHEHLAAEVAALLLARELVFPVDAGGARGDQRLGQLVGVERSAEAGLGIRHDRREPVLRPFAFRVLDLVLADQRVVDAPHDRRHGVGGVEALVGVGLPGQVAVGGDLPAAEVDRLQAGPHLLHGLAAGVGAECADVVLGVQEVPEVLGTALRERALLADRAAEADDVLGREGALDAVPAGVGVPDLLQLGGGLRLVARAQRGLSGGGVESHVVSSSSWMPAVEVLGDRLACFHSGRRIAAATARSACEDSRKFCSGDRIGP